MEIETGCLIAGLALGWLTLGLGIWIARALMRRSSERLYGKRVDRRALFSSYCRAVTCTTDRESLENLLAEEIPAELGIERAALLLPDGHWLVEVNQGALRLAVNHAGVRWVASAGEGQRADHGRLRELIDQTRLDLGWSAAWVPLMRGTKLMGLWLLGAREGGLLFSPEDLHGLTSIAREAAAVLETLFFTEQERMNASEMRSLYRQMVNQREMERMSLARELHDGVLQDMCALTRDLKAAENQTETETTSGELAERSGETVRSLRAICTGLRPPLLGNDLASALRALVEEINVHSSAPVLLDIPAALDQAALEEGVALAVFRITQEALHNAVQHAEASEIAVRLTQYPDRLRLTITDDGVGIQGSVDPARFVAEGHYGMAGMRERAAMIGGALEVHTAAEYGTVVILELPG